MSLQIWSSVLETFFSICRRFLRSSRDSLTVVSSSSVVVSDMAAMSAISRRRFFSFFLFPTLALYDVEAAAVEYLLFFFFLLFFVLYLNTENEGEHSMTTFPILIDLGVTSTNLEFF